MQRQDSDQCRERIESSFAAQQAGDLTQARQHLHDAAQLQPNLAETWWNLADLSIQQDQYATAQTELIRYIELQPSDPQGYLRLAQLYYVQNQYTQASDVLSEALRRSPNQIDAIMLSARLARKQADQQAAIADYYHALQVDPQNVEAILELAELLISRHEPTRAASLLRQMIRRQQSDTDLARAHLNLGIAYGQERRWDNAVAHLEQADLLDGKKTPRDQYRLAYAHWKSGGSQQALKVLIELADRGDWNPRANQLYTLMTETPLHTDAASRVAQVSSEISTVQADPFSQLSHRTTSFLPDRLVAELPETQTQITPPEWLPQP